MTGKKKSRKQNQDLYAIIDDDGDVAIYLGKPKIEVVAKVRENGRAKLLSHLCNQAATVLKLKPGVLTKLNVTLEEIKQTQ